MKSNITIWSGFQTGADIAGIKAAISNGLETKGFMPKGYITENGKKPEYSKLGAVTTTSDNYAGRTLKNVISTDCTIIFDEAKSGGSKLTKTFCMKNGKPYLYLNKVDIRKESTVDDIIKFIKDGNYTAINIAGNRESKSKGIEKRVFNILNKAFTKLNE